MVSSAMMDIRTIARIMGGEVTGRGRANVPGPNHSRKDRSLSIRLGADGRLTVHSFANDDWKDCRDYVRSKLGLADDWRPNNTLSRDNTGGDETRRKKAALRIWADCTDPRGTLVETYLREHRGLKLPDEIACSVIRFHAGLYYDGKYLPAMVALLRDIKSDEPVGIHRTYLHRYDAAKIDRRMLGVAKRAAIKFDPVASSLVIGEGVETVLAAREAGFRPAWALGSAGAIGRFPVLRGVCELIILLENDATSRRNVSLCLLRYRDAGRTVKVIQSNVGSDFNDAGRAHHG
jgi:hypothetical protein